ncbi:bifunctional 3,4-dihydroxy-2-butanone 4-phosphate synthase/GTP cyclohydrolase II [Aliarcobacter butzleri]|uniref:bifunctional 3,4-dihydroxy-2-butanone 4-phosphate synthase/GTP cyclohydrolase II n=1 Tax=Aliarcobacter butzleri TaxID=28197 RepID=UPI001EDB5E46|nr:bifunctional 3,4-dihydroxy-2-butanone 4-phosphate synthase/GTP cyclohydrolase II [Aliarcobacter butzleri]MCG3678307.1 bifunctional 3,4-dihydroxy-2-butanone 4-phosphate synthase/GTP cyclohydrolase II [Aliarcobacter butzleri]MCT7549199.1 bifunctional 3,4-dihydroxy-2-butanone 4-phosphate synthase/GTP cyclohydrolase II [Aliarcobacter butzleri]MCT7558509.1 bifunctional 3,4-dihydroxy-2-butanone 4-phosphate synthase/GTP cyclohydrolase II [Aliarcobacter butzleri]MCT7601464.1 bifunctional 3,4-dihydro
MNAIKRVQEAIKEIQKGNMVIMLDDEDRENEGDLVYSAALSTPDMVNFMVTHAKGLVCVSLPKETADRLELNPMVTSNTSSYETAFTVSVDAASAATGISAIERDDTIKILANPISKTNELVRPGHIFPLIAKDGGVLVRTGHTEGSVDLCKLAGLNGEAVICEILKEDGTMARRDDLDIFALKHNLKQVYISDLVEYRLSHEKLVEEISSANKKFFSKDVIQKEFKDHLGNIHTAIIFGEIKEISHIKFHTIRPDIKMFLNDDKLHSMLKTINFMQAKGGILIFLNNGRKNSELEKNYGIGAQILNSLNIKQIKLMTSGGKHSFVGLQGFGLEIVEEIQIEG